MDHSRDSAIQAALAAARAEIEKSRRDETAAAGKGSQKKDKGKRAARSSANEPVKVTKESLKKKQSGEPASAGQAKAASDKSAAEDLDPDSLKKLKTLRRLNPSKSDEDLLKILRQEQAKEQAAKQKRSWFSLR